MLKNCLIFLLLLWFAGLSRAQPLPHVVIAGEDDWYPYSAMVDGTPQGFAVDIVRAAFLAVGIQADIEAMPYSRCMQLTLVGRRMACFDTSRDASLVDQYLWHKRPLYLARILILAPADAPAGPVTVKDLEGKLVGVTNGYTYSDEVDLNPRIRKETSIKDIDSLHKLAVGRLDYALVFEKVAAYLMSGKGAALRDKIKVVGAVHDMALYLTFTRADPQAPQLVDAFDRGLALIRSNGTYRRIEAKWAQNSLPGQ